MATNYLELTANEARALAAQLLAAANGVEAHNAKNGLDGYKYVRPETAVLTNGSSLAIRVGSKDSCVQVGTTAADAKAAWSALRG